MAALSSAAGGGSPAAVPELGTAARDGSALPVPAASPRRGWQLCRDTSDLPLTPALQQPVSLYQPAQQVSDETPFRLSPKGLFLSLCCPVCCLPAQGCSSLEFCLACLPNSSAPAAAPQLGKRLQVQVIIAGALAAAASCAVSRAGGKGCWGSCLWSSSPGGSIVHLRQDSSLPVGVFIWEVENGRDEDVEVSIMFSLQNGPGAAEAGSGGHWNEPFTFHKDGQRVAGVLLHHCPPMNPFTLAISAREKAGTGVTHVTAFNPTGLGREVWQDLLQDGRLDSPPGECLHPPWDGCRGAGQVGGRAASGHPSRAELFPPASLAVQNLPRMLWLVPQVRLYPDFLLLVLAVVLQKLFIPLWGYF
ncbi:uncharacterized protein [Agelaius tricolor]|uniref:uncharacterized protein n=1 Tax=Agelaius tricolor TaxID=9191 RepID=UPI0039F19261